MYIDGRDALAELIRKIRDTDSLVPPELLADELWPALQDVVKAALAETQPSTPWGLRCGARRRQEPPDPPAG